MTYPGVAEAALLEGPNWGKYVAPYIVYVFNSIVLFYSTEELLR